MSKLQVMTSKEVMLERYPTLSEDIGQEDLDFMLEHWNWLESPETERPYVHYVKRQSRFRVEGGKRLFVEDRGIYQPEYPDDDGLPRLKEFNGMYFEADKKMASAILAKEAMEAGVKLSQWEQDRVKELISYPTKYTGDDLHEGIEVEVKMNLNYRDEDLNKPTKQARIKVVEGTEEWHRYLLYIGDPDPEHLKLQYLERYLFPPKKR